MSLRRLTTYLPLPLRTPTSRRLSTALPPPSSRRLLTYSALLSAGLFSGISLALVLPRPQLLSLLFPHSTPHALHPESDEGILHVEDVEAGLQELEIVKRLRAELVEGETSVKETSLEGKGRSEGVKKWRESRPFATAPGPHSLSAHTLRGPGKFAVAPLVFTSRDNKEAVFILHLGANMCGHEGVIHGGLLATVLDEALGRTAFFALPSNIGVTASLDVKYKKPTFANQYVVIRTQVGHVNGRKVRVKGHIEDLEGQTLVEAEALFVEPKMAKFLKSSSVREALK